MTPAPWDREATLDSLCLRACGPSSRHPFLGAKIPTQKQNPRKVSSTRKGTDELLRNIGEILTNPKPDTLNITTRKSVKIQAWREGTGGGPIDVWAQLHRFQNQRGQNIYTKMLRLRKRSSIALSHLVTYDKKDGKRGGEVNIANRGNQLRVIHTRWRQKIRKGATSDARFAEPAARLSGQNPTLGRLLNKAPLPVLIMSPLLKKVETDYGGRKVKRQTLVEKKMTGCGFPRPGNILLTSHFLTTGPYPPPLGPE